MPIEFKMYPRGAWAKVKVEYSITPETLAYALAIHCVQTQENPLDHNKKSVEAITRDHLRVYGPPELWPEYYEDDFDFMQKEAKHRVNDLWKLW